MGVTPSPRGRMLIVSTDCGGGTGAYTMLGNYLQAHPVDNKPALLMPRTSEWRTVAEDGGFVVCDLPGRRDRWLTHALALPGLARHLRGIRGVTAWHSRGFDVALALGRLLGIPSFGVFHDEPYSRTHGRFRKALMHFCAPRFTARIFPSQAVLKAWSSLIPETDNFVVPNGLPDLKPSRTELAGVCRIGFLGMYSPQKGFRIVSHWISALQSAPVEWRLYGNVHSSHIEEASALVAAFPTRVKLMGRRAPQDIFSEIDLLVLPSVGFDTFPTVLLEAARAGIPVVASSLGGAPEIVREQKTGFLFDPRQPEAGLNALTALVEDAALRMRQGNAARAHFEANFSIGPMVQGYRAIWERFGAT